MAQQVRLIRLTWENDVKFKMETKIDDGSYVTVIEIDENGHLAKLWDGGVKNVCMNYIEEEIDTIGTEMKA